MRTFIYLTSVVVCFGFLYLVAFPGNVEAGGGTCAYMTCNINCTGGDCSGTDGDDIICGTSGVDNIFAGKGDDIVCGEGDNDILQGGWGCDDLYGGAGDNDVLMGGHCEDYFDGGPGTADTCLGGWGADLFTVVGNCENADQGQTVGHKNDATYCEGCYQ